MMGVESSAANVKTKIKGPEAFEDQKDHMDKKIHF